MAQRKTGIYTRAAILLAASGVLTSVQSSSWVSGWQFISVALSILAAVFGLWALRPYRGWDSNATKSVKERLNADPYSTEYSIVDDNIAALKDEIINTEKLVLTVGRGYLVLAAAWLTTIIVAALHAAQLI